MTRSLAFLLPLLLACPSPTLVCPQGEVGCGGACVSLASDDANCGACGTACDAGRVCDAGACACAPGTQACGEACADLASDPAHCGGCDVVCADGWVCSQSACALTCEGGLTACGAACVDLDADPAHCGACGVACAAGRGCDRGTCRSVAVACLATDDVRTVSPDLASLGPARAAGDGPVSLAVLGSDLFASASLSSSVVALPLGGGDGRELLLPGGADLENVVADAGRLLVSSSGTGTLLVVDPADGTVLDEIPLATGTGASAVNPLGVAVVGHLAFVALYGQSSLGPDEPQPGQAIAVVDLTGLETCAGPPCGSVVKTISVLAGADEPGYPFPSRVVADGTKVYVTLANLAKGAFGYYTDPAGPGRLAVIDSQDLGAAPSFVTLGEGCRNPGGLALDGSTLWVSCGDGTAPALLPVALGESGPAPGSPRATPAFFVPGRMTFCAGRGFVGDQWSGQVLAFDPADPQGGQVSTVCPLSDAGWAMAADVACTP